MVGFVCVWVWFIVEIARFIELMNHERREKHEMRHAERQQGRENPRGSSPPCIKRGAWKKKAPPMARPSESTSMSNLVPAA